MLDFDERLGHDQVRHDGRARRRVLRPVFRVDLVHRGEVRGVLQVHRDGRHLFHAATRGLEARGQVVEDPRGLRADVAGDNLAGRLDRQHARKVDEVAGRNCGAEGRCRGSALGRRHYGEARHDQRGGDDEEDEQAHGSPRAADHHRLQ